MMVYSLVARIALFLLSSFAARIAAQRYNVKAFVKSYSLIHLSQVTSPAIQTRDTAIRPGFPYGSQKIRGVNLGGWLVLEVLN